jgi:hypothetical protein
LLAARVTSSTVVSRNIYLLIYYKNVSFNDFKIINNIKTCVIRNRKITNGMMLESFVVGRRRLLTYGSDPSQGFESDISVVEQFRRLVYKYIVYYLYSLYDYYHKKSHDSTGLSFDDRIQK